MYKFKFLSWKNKIENRNDYFVLIFLFVIFNFFLITKIKTPVITPDEINTLAIPAWISGNKWDINTAYYGWGGSIIYSLLFMLIKNPITLYRGILLLNSLILSIIPCIVFNVLKNFFDLKNKKLLITISILIGLYPGNFSMALYSWNEIWVRVIVWIILFLLLSLIKNGDNNIKKNSVLLGFFLAYGYSIHGRMLAMIPTICIMYMFIYIKYKIKIFKIIFTLIGFFPMFLTDIIVKKIINRVIFKGEVLGNTFSDVINKLVKFPNKKSIFAMMRAVFSYTYYLEIMTFGLLFLLIIILLKLLKNSRKEKINFEILELIRKSSDDRYELNFINEEGRYPLNYLMLLNNYNVVYDESKTKENIINPKEQLDFISNYKETLMLSNDTYKINTFSNDINEYNLYYKGKNLNKILESKKIKSEKFDNYIISNEKMFISGQTLLNNNNIISNNSILYGPYIELRPNKYKLTISGENFDSEKILLNLYAKKNNEEKSNLISYLIISKSENLYVVEFTLDSFMKDFEVVIINNSGRDIKLNSIKIGI